MVKKEDKTNKKPLTDSDVNDISSEVAKRIVGIKKNVEKPEDLTGTTQIAPKRALFSNTEGVNKKKSLILLTGMIIFSITLASFFVFFRDDYYADAENWPLIDKTTGLRAKPSEVLIREGLLSKPVKILEVQFSFNDDSNRVSLYKFTKKNAYPTKSKNPIDNWKAEILDAENNTLNEVFFSRDEEIDDDGYNPSGIKKVNANNIKQKTASINLLWNDNASTLRIYNPSGNLALEQDVKNPKSIDNKQQVFGVIGRDKRSTKSSFIDKFDLSSKVYAQSLDSNNGSVDIVFISQGYTSANMSEFNAKFGEARNTILQTEPYKSRALSINFFMMPTTQDFGCTGPTTTSTRMTCGDWYQVFDEVNNAGYRFDKIFVIKKNSLHGGTSGGTWSISSSHDGPDWSTRPEIHKNTIIHELGHSFGLHDEYLTTTNLGVATNTVDANCFTGSGNSSYAFKECRYPNWYRSTLTSTMRDFPTTPFYNNISTNIVAKNLDSYIDSIPPTVSINPLSTGVSTSSVTSLSPTTITVNAADNIGISKVELYADNSLVGSDIASPYSYNWDPSTITIKGTGAIAANTAYRVQVTGIANVPKSAGYVAMNIAVVNPSSSGNIMAYPCDSTKPPTSNINYLANTVSNGVVFSKISSSGTVCLISNFSVNIVVEVVGYQAPSTNYSDLGPSKRILDTRSTNKINTAGSVQTVQVGGVQGIPSTSAGVHLNVVAVSPKVAGEMTVFPCDKTRPSVPNVIYGSGNTTSVVSFVQMSATGTVCVHTSAEAHLVIDGYGYFTSQNQYTYLPDAVKVASNSSLSGGKVASFNLSTKVSSYSVGSKAVYGTVTALNPTENGNISIYPCDKPFTTSSALNYYAGIKKSSAFISGIALDGSICTISTKNVAVNIDVIGIFGPNTSYSALPPTRILDTRPGTITKTSFQSGIRELFAKAYDISGKSTKSTVIKVTY